MAKDCTSEDDFASDEERIINGQKQLMSEFERAMKDFQKAGKKKLSLENLQDIPFAAESTAEKTEMTKSVNSPKTEEKEVCTLSNFSI